MSTLGQSPYEQMAKKYAECPQEMSFGWYISVHMAQGFVFATPEFFAMGRPVNKDATPERITDPLYVFPREEQNCWYVHACAGSIEKAWGMLPYPLGFVAFERVRNHKRELEIVALERLRRLSPNQVVITSIHSR